MDNTIFLLEKNVNLQTDRQIDIEIGRKRERGKNF